LCAQLCAITFRVRNIPGAPLYCRGWTLFLFCVVGSGITTVRSRTRLKVVKAESGLVFVPCNVPVGEAPVNSCHFFGIHEAAKFLRADLGLEKRTVKVIFLWNKGSIYAFRVIKSARLGQYVSPDLIL
jgi:hypothetical protein